MKYAYKYQSKTSLRNVVLILSISFILAGIFLPYILGNPEESPIEKCFGAPSPSEESVEQTLISFLDAEASGDIEVVRQLYTEKARQRFDEWVKSRGQQVVVRFLKKKMLNFTLVEYSEARVSSCGNAWVQVSFFGKQNELVEQAEYHFEVEAGEWRIAFVLSVEEKEVMQMA